MRKNIAKNHVLSLFHKLATHHGPQHWWPARSKWEMMVGAILTQNTAWGNVEKALRSLKAADVLSAPKTIRLHRGRLEKLIRPAGFFRQKAHRLQILARAYQADPTLISNRPRLLSLHGIGPETADSILLYAGKYASFVVDAYTRRMGQRLGWFDTDDYDVVQSYFVTRLPREVSLYNEYHALIVRHAKVYCKKKNPLCSRCPVQRDCLYGRSQ